jgi:catechol 2,3-dioxygenase-like lactoylglutathione lyase family enzyme
MVFLAQEAPHEIRRGEWQDTPHAIVLCAVLRVNRGERVEVGEIRHKAPVNAWGGGFAPGLDPARRDYASFADFSDPDGNSWVLQERGYRNV